MCVWMWVFLCMYTCIAVCKATVCVCQCVSHPYERGLCCFSCRAWAQDSSLLRPSHASPAVSVAACSARSTTSKTTCTPTQGSGPISALFVAQPSLRSLPWGGTCAMPTAWSLSKCEARWEGVWDHDATQPPKGLRVGRERTVQVVKGWHTGTYFYSVLKRLVINVYILEDFNSIPHLPTWHWLKYSYMLVLTADYSELCGPSEMCLIKGSEGWPGNSV